MPYRQQPVPFPLLETAEHYELVRASFFQSRGAHYKGARQDALLRAAGHRRRLELGE